ncbi:unnamed protein product [Commensalibacter communis]|uniref:Uncharacterized protein n=1 Tax=Commensalibacter communis TaxID=2972786 RepID=A0A9W4TP95_9PROT|nr:hypothetical protein [Commensalibacter communis]CAI3950069.1 unnamed protein product [Commensalibacter communis]CAI3952996.1 unnamed protein product [Commensalibacter communis]CAI3954080.1 unnamed protein product [Commensalibacter communis]CAI3954145.1 unnamed protein product [Commensalibacter communis]CAI3955613.1 unnamed protein product [Commensalibacter communis]
MKKIILFLLLLSPISFACAKPTNMTIIVDAASLKKAHPETITSDGKAYADIDNDTINDVIEYSYNASAPPMACGNDVNCIDQNQALNSHPTLTFHIILKEPNATIPVSYMCTAIGIMNSIHNGMKDIFCGPSFILQWNGEDYIITK